jgi:hypothetical protein
VGAGKQNFSRLGVQIHHKGASKVRRGRSQAVAKSRLDLSGTQPRPRILPTAAPCGWKVFPPTRRQGPELKLVRWG